MAADWNNLQSVFGLNLAEINQLKQAGYSADQASQLLDISSGGGGTSLTGTGGSSTGSVASLPTIGGSGLSPQTLTRLASALGKGGGGQGASTGMPVSGVNQNDPLTNLGAAALNQNAVYNPVPGAGGIDPVSGVNTQQPAITTSGVVPNVQQGPWTRTPGVFASATGAVTPGTQIAQPIKPGQQPTQRGPKYQGPTQVSLPSAFAVPPPTAPLPVTPTPQATGMAYRPGQSWATPPEAPTIQAPALGGIGALAAAHNSALADAGQALFAHYGGDPSSASPADIAHFHTQLTGVISGSASPGAIALQPGGGTKKMNTGGTVSGQGNQDTVPAMLEPGEYVLNKSAVGQIGLDRLNQMNQPVRHMQSGGEVDQPKLPPETKHQRILQAAATRNKSATSDAAQPTAQGGTQPSGGGLGGGLSFQDLMAIRQQHEANVALNSGGASGGGYNIPGGGYVGASPGAGQSGYIYPNQAAATAAGDVGTGVGGAGAGAGAAGAASAIGGIGSAIAKAAQTYADSIKGWQMQKSAIPNPDDFTQQPQITLQQPGLV